MMKHSKHYATDKICRLFSKTGRERYCQQYAEKVLGAFSSLFFLHQIPISNQWQAKDAELLRDQRRLLTKKKHEKRKMEELHHTWKKCLRKGNRKLWACSNMQCDKESPSRFTFYFLVGIRCTTNLCRCVSVSLLTRQDPEDTTLLEVQVFYPYIFPFKNSKTLISEKLKVYCWKII